MSAYVDAEEYYIKSLLYELLSLWANRHRLSTLHVFRLTYPFVAPQLNRMLSFSSLMLGGCRVLKCSRCEDKTDGRESSCQAPVSSVDQLRCAGHCKPGMRNVSVGYV